MLNSRSRLGSARRSTAEGTGATGFGHATDAHSSHVVVSSSVLGVGESTISTRGDDVGFPTSGVDEHFRAHGYDVASHARFVGVAPHLTRVADMESPPYGPVAAATTRAGDMARSGRGDGVAYPVAGVAVTEGVADVEYTIRGAN